VAASLTERERQVLEAVIETYVATAEPAGSRTIAKRFALAVSAATVRNTMSDLEEKGYLYHPHTSAGRIPTDLAYRIAGSLAVDAPQQQALLELETTSARLQAETRILSRETELLRDLLVRLRERGERQELN